MIAAARRLTILAGALVVLGACASEPPPDMTAEQAFSGRLAGTVTYRERIALSPESIVTVRLEDISRADAPARVLAEQSIDAAGRSVPIPYELQYDPASIDPRMSYAVRAEIRDGTGKLLWVSDTVHPVLTRGAPRDDVEIMVVRARR